MLRLLSDLGDRVLFGDRSIVGGLRRGGGNFGECRFDRCGFKRWRHGGICVIGAEDWSGPPRKEKASPRIGAATR